MRRRAGARRGAREGSARRALAAAHRSDCCTRSPRGRWWRLQALGGVAGRRVSWAPRGRTSQSESPPGLCAQAQAAKRARRAVVECAAAHAPGTRASPHWRLRWSGPGGRGRGVSRGKVTASDRTSSPPRPSLAAERRAHLLLQVTDGAALAEKRASRFGAARPPPPGSDGHRLPRPTPQVASSRHGTPALCEPQKRAMEPGPSSGAAWAAPVQLRCQPAPPLTAVQPGFQPPNACRANGRRWSVQEGQLGSAAQCRGSGGPIQERPTSGGRGAGRSGGGRRRGRPPGRRAGLERGDQPLAVRSAASTAAKAAGARSHAARGTSPARSASGTAVRSRQTGLGVACAHPPPSAGEQRSPPSRCAAHSATRARWVATTQPAGARRAADGGCWGAGGEQAGRTRCRQRCQPAAWAACGLDSIFLSGVG